MAFIVINGICYLGASGMQVLIWAMVNDAIDYHELQTGERNEGCLLYTSAGAGGKRNEDGNAENQQRHKPHQPGVQADGLAHKIADAQRVSHAFQDVYKRQVVSPAALPRSVLPCLRQDFYKSA